MYRLYVCTYNEMLKEKEKKNDVASFLTLYTVVMVFVVTIIDKKYMY